MTVASRPSRPRPATSKSKRHGFFGSICTATESRSGWLASPYAQPCPWKLVHVTSSRSTESGATALAGDAVGGVGVEGEGEGVEVGAGSGIGVGDDLGEALTGDGVGVLMSTRTVAVSEGVGDALVRWASVSALPLR